jgi:hypothetical protein
MQASTHFMSSGHGEANATRNPSGVSAASVTWQTDIRRHRQDIPTIASPCPAQRRMSGGSLQAPWRFGAALRGGCTGSFVNWRGSGDKLSADVEVQTERDAGAKSGGQRPQTTVQDHGNVFSRAV